MPNVRENTARWFLPAVLLGALLGCDDELQSPTEPQASPTLSTAAAAAPLSFAMISAGAYHTCGVTTDNKAYCWGSATGGALGDGTVTTHRLAPFPVSGGLRFLQISAGAFYTCGVTTTNRAYCWGQNFSAQLGDGTATERLSPVPVLGNHLFRSVRAGGNHTCGVDLSGKAWCWGRNAEGQLGDGSEFRRRFRPVAVFGDRTWRRVIAGSGHTCGTTTSDRAFCWGWNNAGEIGDGTFIQRRTPRAVAGGLLFRQVLAGASHSCGVTPENRAYCWGQNRSGSLDGGGQLGDGTTTIRTKPVAVVGGLRFRGVVPGAGRTCGVTTTDRAYCWGDNTNGALGNGTRSHSTWPVAVSGDLLFTDVSTGMGSDGHSCGLIPGNKAYCWGYNGFGQLGDGTTTTRLTPVPVTGPGA